MANTSIWIAVFLMLSLICYNYAFKASLSSSLKRSRFDNAVGEEGLRQDVKRGCIGWARHKRKCLRGRKRGQEISFEDQVNILNKYLVSRSST